jgi:hypothetical protein
MYRGPPIDDPEILARLPVEYAQLLQTMNGYVAYHGGLHVRGACLAPDWHSIRSAWEGEHAIHRLFPAVSPEDVPFAQDVFGDQFVLRQGTVWRLDAEAGTIVSLAMPLWEFDAAVRADPDEFLSLAPLREHQAQGGTIEPGQLLSVFPPFVLRSQSKPSYRAISARDRIRFLSNFAAQIKDIPDGSTVEMKVEKQ